MVTDTRVTKCISKNCLVSVCYLLSREANSTHLPCYYPTIISARNDIKVPEKCGQAIAILFKNTTFPTICDINCSATIMLIS